MKVEYVKPFAQAAYDVLKDIVDSEITRGKVSIMKTPMQMNEVLVVIGLAGEVEGRVIFDMSLDSAKKIAELMNYEEFESFHHLAKATISELGNIITGRAVSLLNDSGFKFTITPPILIVGKGMETTDIVQEALVIPLEFATGSFNVNVSLKNGKC